MRPQSLPLPLATVGNRRMVTFRQAAEDSEIEAFVKRFPQSFEKDDAAQVFWFIEPSL